MSTRNNTLRFWIAPLSIVLLFVAVGVRDFCEAQRERWPDRTFRSSSRDSIKEIQSVLASHHVVDRGLELSPAEKVTQLRSFLDFAFTVEASRMLEQIEHRNAAFKGSFTLQELERGGYESMLTVGGVYVRERVCASDAGDVSVYTSVYSLDHEVLRQWLRLVVEAAAARYDCDDIRVDIDDDNFENSNLSIKFENSVGQLHVRAISPLLGYWQDYGRVSFGYESGGKEIEADTELPKTVFSGWTASYQTRPYPDAPTLTHWNIDNIPDCTWERNGEVSGHGRK